MTPDRSSDHSACAKRGGGRRGRLDAEKSASIYDLLHRSFANGSACLFAHRFLILVSRSASSRQIGNRQWSLCVGCRGVVRPDMVIGIGEVNWRQIRCCPVCWLCGSRNVGRPLGSWSCEGGAWSRIVVTQVAPLRLLSSGCLNLDPCWDPGPGGRACRPCSMVASLLQAQQGR